MITKTSAPPTLDEPEDPRAAVLATLDPPLIDLLEYLERSVRHFTRLYEDPSSTPGVALNARKMAARVEAEFIALCYLVGISL